MVFSAFYHQYPICIRFSRMRSTFPARFILLDFILLVVKVKVTLRLTVGQSVCLDVEPALGLVTRYYLLTENCCLVSVGRPL
jgi:hypothetical protein